MDGIGCAVALAAGVGEGSTAVGVGTEYCALEEASQFPALAVASKGMKKYTHIKMFTVKTIHSPTLRNFWRGDLFHAVRRSSIIRSAWSTTVGMGLPAGVTTLRHFAYGSTPPYSKRPTQCCLQPPPGRTTRHAWQQKRTRTPAAPSSSLGLPFSGEGRNFSQFHAP